MANLEKMPSEPIPGANNAGELSGGKSSTGAEAQAVKPKGLGVLDRLRSITHRASQPPSLVQAESSLRDLDPATARIEDGKIIATNTKTGEEAEAVPTIGGGALFGRRGGDQDRNGGNNPPNEPEDALKNLDQIQRLLQLTADINQARVTGADSATRNSLAQQMGQLRAEMGPQAFDQAVKDIVTPLQEAPSSWDELNDEQRAALSGSHPDAERIFRSLDPRMFRAQVTGFFRQREKVDEIIRNATTGNRDSQLNRVRQLSTEIQAARAIADLDAQFEHLSQLQDDMAQLQDEMGAERFQQALQQVDSESQQAPFPGARERPEVSEKGPLGALTPEQRKILKQTLTEAGVQELVERASPAELREYLTDFFGEEVGESADVNAEISPQRQMADHQAEVAQPEEKDEEPSPVQGLTMKELDLFLNSGETIEGLNEIIERVGIQAFLQQARPRLEYLRTQETPAQKAEREAAERAKRIKELEADREKAKDMSEGTDDEKRLKQMRKNRINQELRSLSGEGGDSGNGGTEVAGGSEGPSEGPGSLELEASPERGRQIAEEIIKWEGLRADGQLSKVNWERLNYLYLQHEIHIEAARIISLKVKPSERKAGQEAESEVRKVNAEAFKGFRSVNEWITDYEEGAITTDAEWDRFNHEIDIYFREARESGLLKDLDSTLAAAWREVRTGIGRGKDSAEIMYGLSGVPGIEQRIQAALSSVTNIYRSRQRELLGLASVDPRTNRLVVDPHSRRIAGIWDLYAERAIGRFADVISRGDLDGASQTDYLVNEFHLGEKEGLQQETFWRSTHGWYTEVYAQTPEEFMIAADSYISILESITADPKKILDQATQFVEVLSKSDGAQRLLQTKEGKEFIKDLILGIEARVGVFGADDSNERYIGENYKAYLDYTNKDGKGPDRYLQLLKILDGRVAAALWKLDKDPRFEILFATYGSRGQLAKMAIAQRDRETGQGIHNQAYDMLIEEMLGVQIRNRDDVAKLTQFMPDRTFTSFFDGLYEYDSERKQPDYGDLNIRAWNVVKGVLDDRLTPVQRQSARNGVIRLGRIQEALRNGEELKLEDQRFYDRAYAEAKKAVDIAFQVYGAFGEKSKRAGGVFKTAEKIDAKGKKYQYFIPIHWAEKWIQCAETLTKIQYAYLSAKDRKAKVAEARRRNVTLLKRDGYEAIMVDADGRQMKLKKPKENSRQPDGLERDRFGNTVPIEVLVDFHTATHHPYANWSGHTYWSYQEEHRHLLLSPIMFAQAKQIREGKLRPEDADPVAVQLLVLDPTLRRVRRFEKGFEDRERKLTMAAVEDSYQSHWRITRELYDAFWPKYGTPAEEIGIYNGLQDYGGYRKTLESMRARIAEDPERFARRGRRLLASLHNPVATLPEYLGQGNNGGLGAIRMMGYPMYRLAGTFALDKFAVNGEIGGRVFERLVGGVDREGKYDEGLLLKLTNNSDKLVAVVGKIPEIGQKWVAPGVQNEFCYGLMESLGRLQRYESLLTVMETQVRNASGALWLEDVDILTDDGNLDSETERRLASLPSMRWVGDKQGNDITRDELASFITEADKIALVTEEEYNEWFNKEVIDESGSPDTGSGRHSAKIFHNAFGELLIDEEKRGGVELYPGEKFPYAHIKDKIIIANPAGRGKPVRRNETIWDFIFGKFVPT